MTQIANTLTWKTGKLTLNLGGDSERTGWTSTKARLSQEVDRPGARGRASGEDEEGPREDSGGR